MKHQLNENDYQILARLISLSQKQTKKTASAFLKKYYPKVVETRDYIIAEGDIPVALCAHMDTVFEKKGSKSRNNLLYDTRKNIMWHPHGAGFDDRAGIFAIFKIIREGYRPHVILTTDEEKGGLGALELVTKIPVCPFEDLKYVIELDRANTNDCVFYECNNEEFIDYVESFGFIEDFGSFSDIDTICPEWEVAGVNLSIGYKDEHTASETLNVSAMLATINKVKKMLDAVYELTEPFIYIPSPYAKLYYRHGLDTTENYGTYYSNYGYDSPMLVKCDKCGQTVIDYEAIPVKKFDGTTGFYCCDCIVDQHIGWCRNCGEAFERSSTSKVFCDDCEGHVNWKR